MALLDDRRGTLVGFAAALALLVLVYSTIGIQRTLRAVLRADGRVVALLLPVAVAWLTCWGLALRTVLSGLDVDVGPGRALLLYAAATFANSVTPFGQAGGEPITAFVISESTGADYETGLAAIASVDAIHFVPTAGLAGAGLVYFATRLTFGRQLLLASAAVAGFAVAVPVLAYLAWRYRAAIERAAVAALGPILRAVARVLPRRQPPTPEALRERVRSFFVAIGRVADDRPRLARALLFSAAGWLCLMGSLWLSLFALGYAVAFPVVLVAIPVASMAGIAPLPGGLGALESLLVGLLATLSGVGAGGVAAAVVLHRAATYLLPLVAGAASTSLLTAGASAR